MILNVIIYIAECVFSVILCFDWICDAYSGEAVLSLFCIEHNFNTT